MPYRRQPAALLALAAVLVMVLGMLPGAAFADNTLAPSSQNHPLRQQATGAEQKDDWQRIQSAGTMVIGTAADYPPFEFYNSKYELDGFDIALINAIGEQLGVKVEIKDFAFDGLIDAVRLGQVDAAISAISVTPDRQKVVDFSNIYYVGDDAVLANKAFTGTVTSVSDFAGAKIGVERGTTYQTWVQSNVVNQGIIPQENLHSYDNVDSMLRDLRNGKIDLAPLGKLPANDALQKFPDLKIVGQGINPQQFAIAAPKGSSLTGKLTDALLKLQSNGQFAKLVTEYLNASPDAVTPEGDAAKVDNTPAITTTPAITATPSVTIPATIAPPPCIDGSAFVADLNMDDLNMTAPTVMQPGQDFAKSWRLRNSGTCAWQPNFQLSYVRGNRAESSMGAVPVPVGRVVQPGETVDLTAYLRAPQTYGTFQGFWQMQNAAGDYFGQVVWVGIQVPDPNPPPPPPPPPPSSVDPNLRADSSYINAGECTTIRWDVDGVQAVYFLDGNSTQGVSGHDSRTVCPMNTQTYVLRVVQTNGASTDYSITITVGSGPNAQYTMNFWVDNGTINAGQCTTLRWDVRNVQAVYLDGEGVAGVSSREVCPSHSKTYTLTATLLNGGQDSRQVTINVNNAPPPTPGPSIQQFDVSANQIRLGQCIDVLWQTSNTNSVKITRNGSTIVSDGGSSGRQSDCPPAAGQYEYKLEARGNGSKSQKAYLEVSGAQPR